MARFIELHTPTGDVVFINPDQVNMLRDKGAVTHVHFAADNNGLHFVGVHLPIHEVAKKLATD